MTTTLEKHLAARRVHQDAVGLVTYLRSRRCPSRRGPGAGGRPDADKH